MDERVGGKVNQTGECQSMDLQEGIRHMIARSDLTLAEASRLMGRNARYLAVMLNENTTPRVDLLVQIANTCGYDVLLRQPGEVLELTVQTNPLEPGQRKRTSKVLVEDKTTARMRALARESLDELGVETMTGEGTLVPEEEDRAAEEPFDEPAFRSDYLDEMDRLAAELASLVRAKKDELRKRGLDDY